MSSTAHPLPAPPGQHRPRAKSTFSFHSHHSNGSGSNKIDLVETHAEKEGHRLHSKADPTMAITEAEPCKHNRCAAQTAALRCGFFPLLTVCSATIATQAQTALKPIRAIQHLDAQGNPIGMSPSLCCYNTKC
jgi:hypothetical protein